MTRDTFYRQRAELERRGMPASPGPGHIRIPKERFDAWLAGRARPPVPANDVRPAVDKSDDEHRTALARAYARH